MFHCLWKPASVADHLVGAARRGALTCLAARFPHPHTLHAHPHVRAERGANQGDDYLDPDDYPSSGSSSGEHDSDSASSSGAGQEELGTRPHADTCMGPAQTSAPSEELARLAVRGEQGDGTEPPGQAEE